MFQTIVVALDGSESSDKALDYAASLARESGGRIVAVHIKELIAGRFAGPVHVDEDDLQAKISAQVKELGDTGIAAELEVHTSMTGGPAHVIAEAAERMAADAIVTGTRGHTALVGVVVGSVAQRLLHLSPCPIIVVPGSYRPASGASTRADEVSAG